MIYLHADFPHHQVNSLINCAIQLAVAQGFKVDTTPTGHWVEYPTHGRLVIFAEQGVHIELFNWKCGEDRSLGVWELPYTALAEFVNPKTCTYHTPSAAALHKMKALREEKIVAVKAERELQRIEAERRKAKEEREARYAWYLKLKEEFEPAKETT